MVEIPLVPLMFHLLLHTLDHSKVPYKPTINGTTRSVKTYEVDQELEE